MQHPKLLADEVAFKANHMLLHSSEKQCSRFWQTYNSVPVVSQVEQLKNSFKQKKNVFSVLASGSMCGNFQPDKLHVQLQIYHVYYT